MHAGEPLTLERSVWASHAPGIDAERVKYSLLAGGRRVALLPVRKAADSHPDRRRLPSPTATELAADCHSRTTSPSRHTSRAAPNSTAEHAM